MTPEDFEAYVRGLGYEAEVVTNANGVEYSVVRDVTIPTGRLTGTVCDVALQRVGGTPYVAPPAIHTRPHLLRMDTAAPWATQAGQVGPEWQYWSRRYDHIPTPRNIWAHILTVLGEAP